MAARMLDGKVAIVTGGGGSIGAAVALDLAAAGARVVVNDLGTSLGGEGRGDGPAERTVLRIREGGGEAVVSTEDIAVWREAERLVARAIDSFGRLDIVVNNAAILRYSAFQDTSAEAFDAHLRVNLSGVFNVARAAAPAFATQRGGSYIHMVSSTGLIGMAGNSPYLTSKAGVVGLSRSIALDMAALGVRSNCIAPAATSRMSPPRADQAVEALYRDKVRPERVAPLVTYLASDAAAAINGQVIGVRGNELYLYSQPRPVRTLHRSDGWTAETIAEQLGPAWGASLTPLEETYQVFAWPPL